MSGEGISPHVAYRAVLLAAGLLLFGLLFRQLVTLLLAAARPLAVVTLRGDGATGGPHQWFKAQPAFSPLWVAPGLALCAQAGLPGRVCPLPGPGAAG